MTELWQRKTRPKILGHQTRCGLGNPAGFVTVLSQSHQPGGDNFNVRVFVKKQFLRGRANGIPIEADSIVQRYAVKHFFNSSLHFFILQMNFKESLFQSDIVVSLVVQRTNVAILFAPARAGLKVYHPKKVYLLIVYFLGNVVLSCGVFLQPLIKSGWKKLKKRYRMPIPTLMKD